MPSSSLPIIIAVGPVKSTSKTFSAPFSEHPTMERPEFFRKWMTSFKLFSLHTGSLFSAPAEVLIASELTSAEPLDGRIIP